MLEVRLIGRFDIQYDGKSVTLPSRAAQSLFAYLILTAGTLHRREKLAGMLWPDTTEEKARTYLRNELWRIRKALPHISKVEYLLADNLTIGFNQSSTYWLDVAAFKDMSDNAVAEKLIIGLLYYQSEFLPGFYEDWVVLEREHLQVFYEEKVACLLELLEKEQRWNDILEWAERWISVGQGLEAAYRYLMTAYDALGDGAKVTATYERCIKALRELDLETSEQTRALAFKRSSKLNIPIPLTSFIGREKELKEIVALFSKSRLITLTGSGGVGKTRLAIQVVADVLDMFPDGVWFLDLAPLSDPALVPVTFANVLRLRESRDAKVFVTDLLINYLRPRRALVVFDNCEHLIESCAHLVHSLLTSCEGLSILATSREALRVSGEISYRVPSLEIPKLGVDSALEELAKIESVRLFVERATVASSEFAINKENAFTIAQICQRLDGIPLAIELAAARANMLTIGQMFQRLADSFNLLTGGWRTAAPRHQTLRATIEWSYDLLSEPERVLFQRLAVFVGGFTLEAVESVGVGDNVLKSEIIDLLEQLINKSLVMIEGFQRNLDGKRFRMLEIIREYGHEKLSESEDYDGVSRRHLDFFVKLVDEIEAKVEHSNQPSLRDRLEPEIDNLRLALDRALDSHDIIAALRLASALGDLPSFWLTRTHYHEGVERLKTILSHPDATQSTPARLKSLNSYFHMLWHSDGLLEVQTLMEEALALGRQLGDHRDTAFTLCYLGLGATAKGDYSLARSYLEQSLEMWRELQDIKYIGWLFTFLGDVAMLQDEPERARTLYEQSIVSLNEAKDYIFLSLPIRRLGQLAISQGHLLKATTFIKESLQSNWAMRGYGYRGVGACLAMMGALSAAQGQEVRAAKLLAAAEVLLELIQIPLYPIDQQQYELNVSKLRDRLDAPTFARAWMEGRMMTIEQAVAYALNELQ